MTSAIQLRGITWNHSRGFLPMVATAQRFGETHPGVEIVWEKRSLQEFADYPVEQLAETFDLLVVDHPFVGYAARHKVFIPLDEAFDENLSGGFLATQARDSVGASHDSYFYDGHQWALAIDAATPVSSWRPDLLERAKAAVPETWKDLLALAGSGWVAFPSIPVDSLMNFYMFCCALGSEPFPAGGVFIDADTGAEALAMLHELVALCPPDILNWNPIAVYEAMASRDGIAYCPFAYGYSNYARAGYAANALRFGDLCRIRGSERARSTLGGTGLAIAAGCRNPDVALQYACYVASGDCQRGLYVESGGQPGRRSAWTSAETNHLANNFFKDTLPALDHAYLRPRYDGYIKFQDQAALAVHKFLREGGNARQAVSEMRSLFESSQASQK
ncbi:MAG: ABC transporter substrate-binding protein [Terriglobia bacterium]